MTTWPGFSVRRAASARGLIGLLLALVVVFTGVVAGTLGHSRALAQTWAAGVIGFVRGSAEVWLHVDPETRLDLPDLTDAITAWICEGTRA